jgi:hypothetical protein
MNRKLLVTVVVVILAGAGLWLWKQGHLRFPIGGPAGWSRTYGGEGNDEANGVLALGEEGYLVSGGTSSFTSGGKDGWLLKLDPSGLPLWQKAYGGSGKEEFLSLKRAGDGGFVLAGRAQTVGDKFMDAWVLKLDAGGQPVWQETIGGPSFDYAASIVPLAPGGFLVAGATGSYGAGYADLWVLKLAADGKVLWQKAFGGDQWDYAAGLVPTPEGGCVVVGGTQSFAAKDFDAWALKLDPDGKVIWQKTYGGDREDRFYSILLTADQNYLIAGMTASFGAGAADVWVVKLDPNGQVVWQRTFGGKSDDRALSILATRDQGYLVLGLTDSFGTGATDGWLLKLDATGRLQWQKTYGGRLVDRVFAGQETADHGFIMVGGTTSFGAGKAEAWVSKVGADGDMGQDCPPGSSAAVLGESAARVQDTAATVTDTQAAVTAGTTAPKPTSAVVHSQCPPEKTETKPAPGAGKPGLTPGPTQPVQEPKPPALPPSPDVTP